MTLDIGQGVLLRRRWMDGEGKPLLLLDHVNLRSCARRTVEIVMVNDLETTTVTHAMVEDHDMKRIDLIGDDQNTMIGMVDVVGAMIDRGILIKKSIKLVVIKPFLIGRPLYTRIRTYPKTGHYLAIPKNPFILCLLCRLRYMYNIMECTVRHLCRQQIIWKMQLLRYPHRLFPQHGDRLRRALYLLLALYHRHILMKFKNKVKVDHQ
jgi:hypothetical protein